MGIGLDSFDLVADVIARFHTAEDYMLVVEPRSGLKGNKELRPIGILA